MKKILTLVVVLAMVMTCAFALTACSSEYTDIAVLLPNATHGWTGSVLTYAQEYAAELNEAGNYTVTVQTADSSTDMNSQIDDIIANGNTGSVVLLPYDDDAAAGVEKLADAGIPFTMFDRVITDSSDDSVTNVTGDNYGIGYETAKAFVTAGMEVGDSILIIPGDNSSVPVARNLGFYEYLTEEADWTDAEYTAAVTMTDYSGWSRDDSKTLFSNWLSASSVAEIEATDWVFTHDDESVLGILEILESGAGLETDKVAAFLDGTTTVAGSSGSAEIYAVLERNHATDYSDIVDELAGLFSVTYDPAMIQSAMQDMVDYLDGKTVTHDHVISVDVVTATNVASFTGFGFYTTGTAW